MSALREETALAKGFRYDRWIESLGLPIYPGFYVEDLRTLALGAWPERGCFGFFGSRRATPKRVQRLGLRRRSGSIP